MADARVQRVGHAHTPAALVRASLVDGWDAREALTGVFESFSGISIADDLELLEEDVEVRGLNGRTVTIAESENIEDEWTLKFSYADKVESIECVYDVSARVWDDKEGFDLERPYFLSTDKAPTGAWTVIADIWRYLVSAESTDSR